MLDDASPTATEIAAAIDNKTKPPGSLGRLEALAAQLCRVQGTLTPTANAATLLLIAADHGIADEGVSAYPQAVTRQMLLNFLAGGAAANVFARTMDVGVVVVDAGVAGDPVAHPALLSHRIGAGTANSAQGPAMSAAQMDLALATGRTLGADAVGEGLCLGEMGIANTSAAALVAAKLTGRPVDQLAGPGTGLDGPGLAHKRAVLARAAARTADRLAPEDTLQEYGGFEIAMLAGAAMGAARAGKVVLVDGFISTAAALAAAAIEPAARDAMVFAHRSAEPGHRLLLDALDARPLLDLDLRLGEGTGALLAWPLVRAAAAMMTDMATFDDADVSRA